MKGLRSGVEKAPHTVWGLLGFEKKKLLIERSKTVRKGNLKELLSRFVKKQLLTSGF